MKKLLIEIITHKAFLIWLVITAILFGLFFHNYQEKISSDESNDFMYSIGSYTNKEELNKLRNHVLVELEELDKNSSDYEYNYKFLNDLLKIYETLEDSNINFSDVNKNVPGTYSASRSTYIIKSKTFLYACTLVLVIILIFIVFTREFDTSLYVFIYSRDRIKPILNRLFAILIITFCYFIFLSLITCLNSLTYEPLYNYVLVVDSKKAYIINKNLYLFQYVWLNTTYIILTCTLTMFSVALLTRTTIKFVVGLVILNIFVLVCDYFTNFLSYIGLSFNLAEVNMSKIVFDIYWIYLVIFVFITYRALKYFRRSDL